MTEIAKEFDADDGIYKTLLESTNAIPWKIDMATMKFAYIGPQIESLLGWQQNSWVSAQDWADRMHPEDREPVVNYCIAQSKAGIDHEADYRALTKQNGYVWIRDVVHVVRGEDGEVEAIVGFMFDISERKAAEEKLMALQKELEALSFKDGLTGIANRRMFDNSLSTEWVSAQRNQQPISLMLIDIDFFKQYNDHYGHIRGDECLVSVAQTLKLGVTRPRDIVARYGGEEFVVLLPETDAKAAQELADRFLRLIRNRSMPHEKSDLDGLLTVSIGVGSIQPSADSSPKEFLNAVDKMLYKAKECGRNRIEVMP